MYLFKKDHFAAKSAILKQRAIIELLKFGVKIGVGICGSDSRNFAFFWYQLMKAGGGGDGGWEFYFECVIVETVSFVYTKVQ